MGQQELGRHEGEQGHRLQLLKTMSELLQQADGLAGVIHCVQRRFASLLEVDRISVLVYNANRGVLVSGDTVSDASHSDDATCRQHLQVSISGHCFMHAKPVVVNDCPSSDLIPQEFVEQLDLKSSVAVPILLEDLPMGVLRLDDTQRTDRFTSADVEFYQLVAERISLAIRHLQISADRTLAEEALRQAYEDLEQRIEERTDELARLNEKLNRELAERKRAERITELFLRLGQKLSAADTPRAAAEATLNAAEELFGWDACFAYYRSEGGMLEHILEQDRIGPGGQKQDVPSRQWLRLGPMSQKTLKEGPQLILRYHPPGSEKAELQFPMFGAPRRSASLMYVPVGREGDYFGVLSAQSYRPNAYDSRDLDLFGTLASFCSGAFERTRASQNLRRSQEALHQEQAFVQLLGDIAAAANETECPESALQTAVDRICEVTGWPVGHALLRLNGKEPAEFLSARIWYMADEDRFRELQDVSQSMTFSANIGLPGLVISTAAPVLISYNGPEPWMRRTKAVRQAGLCAASAFPVLVGSEVVAILEFFSEENRTPPPRLLEVMGHVGVQLGRVIERRQAAERLAHGALHDVLTGLPNRASFSEALERSTARARRNPAYRFAVLHLDLDRFKLVNDSLGHATGDRLLADVAQRLQGCIREGDVVARLGGDEFAVLLDDIRGPADAVAAAERMQAALSAPVQLDGYNAYTSASIGIALSRAGGDAEPLDLLRNADVAMYQSKEAGRAGYVLFDGAMHAEVVRNLQIETELRRALDRREFVIHYQPIVSMATGRITGFEALVRWNHPERGLLLPAEFIPLAEETGLIIPIGWEVLRQACLWMRSRLDSGTGEDVLSISVNITARQLREPDLPGRIQSVLREADLPAKHLHLEVTESSVMEQVETTIAVLNGLKQLGVQVLVDDFGTGYSSLSYLAQFPIDALKIDQSFIRGLAETSGHSEVVQAILALACGLRLGVVAEGVETEEQLAELRGLGCELTQGYLFSRPVDGEKALLLPMVMTEGSADC